MTTKQIIPIEEQLRAAAQGYDALWKLVHQHAGDVLPLALGNYITITKADLVRYYRHHPREAEAHVFQEGMPRPQHDAPVLEREGHAYVVKWMSRGRAVKTKSYNNLPDAAAAWSSYWL